MNILCTFYIAVSGYSIEGVHYSSQSFRTETSLSDAVYCHTTDIHFFLSYQSVWVAVSDILSHADRNEKIIYIYLYITKNKQRIQFRIFLSYLQNELFQRIRIVFFSLKV